MKEISIEKVRAAILNLQSNGKTEYAQVVWDLLDNYVSQPARPIVMRQDGPQFTKPIAKRGASAWSGTLTGCAVSAFHTAAQPCEHPAWGYLAMVDGSNSYPMCCEHGEMFNRPGYADWVQTFFGDENSAADVAAHSEAMTD